MTTWSNELSKIVERDDLHISPSREDGKTYGTPTWIWSVVVDGALYGAHTTAKTLAGTKRRFGRKRGESRPPESRSRSRSSRSTERSMIASMTPTRHKGSPYLKPMIGARARAATVKVLPRKVKA